MAFISNLISELTANGKMLLGYALLQSPLLTSFPGITTAFKTALADRTPASYIDLAIQAAMAIAALLRAKKVVQAASNATK